MTFIEKLEQENQIEEQEFDGVMSNVFHSFLINRIYKSDSYLEKKDEVLGQFSKFLETYIELRLVTSTKDKLALINFIDKINAQRELLELQRNGLNISQIRVAGKRLGKKSQSAFSSVR